jgi:hypothetical protein
MRALRPQFNGVFVSLAASSEALCKVEISGSMSACWRLGRQPATRLHQPAIAIDLALRPVQLVLRHCPVRLGLRESVEGA